MLRGGARAPRAPGAGQRRPGDRLALAGAHVDREQGRPAEALAKWGRALDIMDAQRGKLAGVDRAGFVARYAVIYRDPEALLLERGRAAEAFADPRALPRARAARAAGRARPGGRPARHAAARPRGRARGARSAARRCWRTACCGGRGRCSWCARPATRGRRCTVVIAAVRRGRARERACSPSAGCIERGRDAPALEPALARAGRAALRGPRPPGRARARGRRPPADLAGRPAAPAAVRRARPLAGAAPVPRGVEAAHR